MAKILKALFLIFYISSFPVAGWAETSAPFDLTHSEWTKLLKQFVTQKNGGMSVNYKEWSTQKENLEHYLNELSSVKKITYDKWTSEDQLSFWINSYNAFTVKLILDNYPVDSIKDIGGFFSNPWKKSFFQLLEKKRNLDEIEHAILRDKFKETRIHFAINCASISCPPLRDEAYRGAVLTEQLTEQTRNFINDSKHNNIDPKTKTMYLSKIFDWFKDDFEKEGSNLKTFVASHLNTPIPSESLGLYKIKYLNYNWDLNE